MASYTDVLVCISPPLFEPVEKFSQCLGRNGLSPLRSSFFH